MIFKNNLELLTNAIDQTNQFFLRRVHKQVNVAMTLRNWIIGYHIVEYEQLGEDRAIYGKKVLENLSNRLKEKGIKGHAVVIKGGEEYDDFVKDFT